MEVRGWEKTSVYHERTEDDMWEGSLRRKAEDIQLQLQLDGYDFVLRIAGNAQRMSMCGLVYSGYAVNQNDQEEERTT